ncbi:MAG: heme biosynthesis HemY N-terminal domain-containing protein, partial [Rickettsiales bacterium]
MIRLVLFIALLMALSLLVAPLADNPGDLTLQWMGWQVETSVFALLFAVLLLVVAAITVFRVFEWLIHWPGQFKEHRTVHRHEKGLSVITEALAALAVSDIQSAKRLTKRADRLLDHAPISG